MADFLITCSECLGRGKMDYVVQRPMPDMRTVSATVPAAETIRKATKDCMTCGGAGRVNSTEPIPVFQSGRRIGTLPPSFDPMAIKSTSFFYDPRPGDFKRDGDTWIANRTLGPGDLEAVPGFVWERAAPSKP